MTAQILSWRPEGLRCEFLANPVGIGFERPFLQWRLPHEAGNFWQESFQLRSAASAAELEAGQGVWESDWTASSALNGRWPGPSLRSREVTWWSVRVRASSGELSEWSEPAMWETGLMRRSDWAALWVRRPDAAVRVPDRAAYALRRRFDLGELPARARLYLSALGVYEIYLNGERVSDALLRPGWTDYRRRAQYEVIDLDGRLRSGGNALVAVVAPGWYSGRIATRAEAGSCQPVRTPELLAQLELTSADSKRDTLVTDERWEWAPSAIESTDLYDGEVWDLRRAVPLDGADDHLWHGVEVGTGTAGELVAHRAGPLRASKVTKASVTPRDGGTVLIDSGANDTGYLKLQVREQSGRPIEVVYSEILEPTGRLYRGNLRGARCTDTFTCAGNGLETLAPSFSYRGYRYAEVRGLSGLDRLESVEAVTISSAMDQTGRFSSSEALLEQMYELMACSLRANYVDVPTDCPQRDERLGWMADALLFAPMAAYAYDISAFMSKWFDDILDARTPFGGFSDIAPRPPWPGAPFRDGAPAWADAGVLVPWLIFERYGNAEPLERMYPAMLEWLHIVHGANPDGIWRNERGNDYGDWVPAGPDTSHDLFSTCWLYRSTTVAAKVAHLVGDAEGERWLRQRSQAVRAAFTDRYVDSGSGRVLDPQASGSPIAASHFAPVVAEETQTGYVLPLVFGLLDAPVAAKAGDRLAEMVTAAGKRLETGFCGSAFLLSALEQAGHPGLAYDLLLRTEPPSLGFMVEMGATSVWERWDGLSRDGWPACPTMNSFNHYAMSSMLVWLIEGVCGLRPEPDVPALARIAFRPAASRKVGSASFAFEAPAGHLEVGWAWDGDGDVIGRVSVPPGMGCSIAGAVSVDDVPGAAVATDASGARVGEQVVGAGDHEVVWRVH